VFHSVNALSGSPVWIQSGASLPNNGPVSSFWVVPGSPNAVYVTFSSFISSDPGGNVQVSTDGGLSWANIGGTLEDDPVFSLVTHPGDPQVLYVGTLTGIYTSTDRGRTWLTSNVGPANVMVRQLSWFDVSNPDNPTLLAATFGRGAWMGSPVYYATPGLTSVSPSSVFVGSSATTITINGSGFVQDETTATLNGSPLTVTYVSATELQATLPSSLLAGTGTLNLQLSNPAPGGGTSSGASVNVVNPVPQLSSIAPPSALAGSPDTTLSVSGVSFIPGSAVDWNGTPLATTYGSGTSLSAVIPAADLTTAQTATITVVTPGPGGGTSSDDTFTITAPPKSGGGGALGYFLLTLLVGANLVAQGPRLIRRRISRSQS
jgi:hypothetical protein